MAIHLNQSQIQTLLALTVSNMYPSQLRQLEDALSRIKHVESETGSAGGEVTLGTTFGSGNPNP